MVVVAIVSLLMATVFAVLGPVMTYRANAKARSVSGMVHSACEQYRGDFSNYPWLKPAEVSKKMAASLPGEVEILSAKVLAELRGQGEVNRTTDYLGGLDARSMKDLGAGRTLVDPWGREYLIRVNPGTMSAAVWSRGRNGVDETNDGATSDPVKLPKIYYAFRSGDAGDDQGFGE
jgi:type II secretory pathway pseudopilin PulG